MGFKLGIIGLPNVGKSTLFNAISNARADVSNYPFTTIDPNIGIVEVPDERTATISKVLGSLKAIETIIEFVDIAGLVKGASRGEGLGNKFLSNIREVDAVVHVVRVFGDDNIVHVDGSVNVKRDIGIINSELLLADLATTEKKLAAVKTAAKTRDIKVLEELSVLEKLKDGLSKGLMASSIPLKEIEIGLIKGLSLLTLKPQIILANCDEIITENKDLSDISTKAGAKLLYICAKLESEIKDLPADDAKQYLDEIGLKEPALPRLIRSCYELLDLITFFTGNEKETRAWTVKRGAKAPAASGKVHSDMERGFISAEIISFPDLKGCGSMSKARDLGLVRLEGKNYEVKDGDIIQIRFHV